MDKKYDFKLYIKVMCSVCLDNNRKGVFTNCPYCDVERKQIIEASFKFVKESLKKNLSREQKKELIKILKEK
jgi:hypothetical protein